jgi:hypothetical protein
VQEDHRGSGQGGEHAQRHEVGGRGADQAGGQDLLDFLQAVGAAGNEQDREAGGQDEDPPRDGLRALPARSARPGGQEGGQTERTPQRNVSPGDGSSSR